jgi:uncharacterized protein (TIGR02284 family)
MTGTLEDFAASVSRVISICRDAEQGFHGAAGVTNEPALKETLEQYSLQHGQFAAQLQEAVRSTGFDPTLPLGMGGRLYSEWINLKALVTRHDPYAILVEVARGETWVVDTYRDALEKNLPVGIRAVIAQQYAQIQQAHDHLTRLRDAAAPKTPEPEHSAPLQK